MERQLLTQWPEGHVMLAEEYREDNPEEDGERHVIRRSWIDGLPLSLPDGHGEKEVERYAYIHFILAEIGIKLSGNTFPSIGLFPRWVVVGERLFLVYCLGLPLEILFPGTVQDVGINGYRSIVPPDEFKSFSIDDIHPYVLTQILGTAFHLQFAALEDLKGRLRDLGR